MTVSLVFDVEWDGLFVEPVPLLEHEDAVHGKGDPDDKREDVVVKDEDHGAVGLVRGDPACQVPEELHSVEPHQGRRHDLQLHHFNLRKGANVLTNFSYSSYL